MPAAGTAATASGRFRGRTMANASTPSSSATPITVASSGVIRCRAEGHGAARYLTRP